MLLGSLVPSVLIVKGLGQAVDISLVLDAGRKFQTIDGFGANRNPDRWRHGNLKRAFDLLVADLGRTLFRFDCFGTADWLDPARRDASDSMQKKSWVQYRTSKYENCLEVGKLNPGRGALKIPI